MLSTLVLYMYNLHLTQPRITHLKLALLIYCMLSATLDLVAIHMQLLFSSFEYSAKKTIKENDAFCVDNICTCITNMYMKLLILYCN